MNSFTKKVIICLSWILCLFSCDGQLDDVEFGAGEYQGRIVIVPDIQYYTNDESRYIYLDAIVNCCQENQDKISFLLQTGDVTNNNQQWQYENAYNHFFSKFGEKDQLVFCLGNHDYGNNGSSDIRMSNIPAYMQPSYDIKMEGSQWDNYIKKVRFDGKEYGVMVLEFAPRNEVLNWANTILKENGDIPFIILTHAFLNKQGILFDDMDADCDNSDSQKAYKMGENYVNDSKEIYDKIIYNNTNVKMIICGHSLYNDFIATKYVPNVSGTLVPCMMVNFQHDKDGGQGKVGMLIYKDSTFYLYSCSTVEKRMQSLITSFTISL